MYVVKSGKNLRCGYTTGSCAAAAAKAAVAKLNGVLDGEYMRIDTPKGVELEIEVESAVFDGEAAICSVVKDSGDDPDVTNEIEIFARARKRDDCEINIYGGTGIGKITIDGFWGKSGDSAINPVPRKMIESEIRKISTLGYDVEIFIPDGEEVAKKTYNGNIGIVGGLSIIGTSGIVEPMSEDALKKSIFMEVDEICRQGSESIVLFPGNYGEKLSSQVYPDLRGVKMSNFVGETLLYCQMKGFRKIKLVGHIGKFSKLSLGAFNTHSRCCDMRMEAFVYYLALRGELETIGFIKDLKTSEEAVKLLVDDKSYIFGDMARGCISRIKKYLKDENIDIEVVMYSMDYGVL